MSKKSRMDKKILSFSLTLLLVLPLARYIPTVSATEPTAIPNKDEMTISSIAMAESVDPHWAYDTPSAELVMNVYDTLIFFHQQETDEFVPHLATQVPSYANGLIVDRTPPLGPSITFPIRLGEQFHEGQILDAEDVEYSFERWMILDRRGGSTWMIYQPLLDIFSYGHTNPFMNVEIDVAVEAVDTDWDPGKDSVVFNLIKPYPIDVFFQLLAGPWAGIFDKFWAQANGMWNGDLSVDATYPAAYAFHDPPVSPLDAAIPPKMNGAGPYKLDYIDYAAEEWSIVKFDNYWQGWPAPGASGYVSRVTDIQISLWSTRKALFLSDSPTQTDLTYVPRCNISELDASVEAGKARYIKNLQVLALDAMFFNFDIPSDSPYIGTGTWTTGIPTNFFADIDVRKGFAYAFDYNTYVATVWHNEATQPSDPVIPGLPYDDPAVVPYIYNVGMATMHLTAAHGGALWANGFTFTITFNTGNVARETAAYMLKNELEGMNPLFHVEVVEVDWSTFLGDIVNYPHFKSIMPLFITGWTADFIDPHDFVMPFMHTYGNFAYFQSYSNATVDALIELGIVTPDGPPRGAIYSTLQTMYKQEVPSVPLVQPLGRHYERTWVQGWYYNPLYGGSHTPGIDSVAPETPVLYFYHLWKGLDGDINGDGIVDVNDLPELNKYWYPGPPVGAFGYDRIADIWPVMAPDGMVDMMDVTELQSFWGDQEA